MAEDPTTPQPSSTGAPAVQLVYANTAGLRGGAFDVQLDFGYVVPETEDEPPTWLVRVAMSWEHARALHTLLGDQIDKYESRVGKVPDIEKLKIGGETDDDNS